MRGAEILYGVRRHQMLIGFQELYERSVQLENVGGAEKTRRRIWFQR